MTVVPPLADQLLEICTCIEVLIFGGEVIEDFGGSMDTSRRCANSSFGRWPFSSIYCSRLASFYAYQDSSK